MATFDRAMANRSLRTIRSELEFLADSSVITPQQLSTILAQLPNQPVQQQSSFQPPAQSPLPAMANLSVNSPPPMNEKTNGYYSPSPAPMAAVFPQPDAPPAYPVAPAAPPAAMALSTAVALYAYTPTDAGDLQLNVHDRIQVTEYMNAEWWKGRSERTGQEGIFPRSYVRVEDKMPVMAVKQETNYGNVPLEVSQGGGSTPVAVAGEQKPNKGAEMGKKFGKKMGNAAIFGAGATIGSNIVNSIF